MNPLWYIIPAVCVFVVFIGMGVYVISLLIQIRDALREIDTNTKNDITKILYG